MTVGGQQVWKLSLNVEEGQFGSIMESSLNTGRENYSIDEIAQMRADRILLNDPPPRIGSNRGFGNDSMLNGFIEGMNTKFPAKECVVRDVFTKFGKDPNWKEYARLRAVFLLKATGTVKHILELKLGTVRAGEVSVSFSARRPQQRFSSVAAPTIELKGFCPLD